MVKIEVDIDEESRNYLDKLCEDVGFGINDVIEFGIKFLYKIKLIGAIEKEYLIKSIRDRENLLDNIMLIGFRFYIEYIKEIFDNLGINEDGIGIWDLLTENGCLSALTFDSDDLKYGTINFFNHKKTWMYQLSYYIEKPQGVDWISRLVKYKDNIISWIYDKFDPEEVNITIDNEEDYSYVFIDIYTDTIEIKEIEKYLIKKLGPIPT